MKEHDDDDWVPEKEAGPALRGRGFAASNTAEAYLPQNTSPIQQGHFQQRIPSSEPLLKLSDTAAPPEPSYCQVEGCAKDIRQEKDYYQRYRICEEHLKLGSLLKDGVPQRFCQQCGRFHLVGEFDGDKRSCRARLSLHNNRRRKRGGLADTAEGGQPARGRRNKARDVAQGRRQPTRAASEVCPTEVLRGDAVAEVRFSRAAHADHHDKKHGLDGLDGSDTHRQKFEGDTRGGGRRDAFAKPESPTSAPSEGPGYRSVVTGDLDPMLGGRGPPNPQQALSGSRDPSALLPFGTLSDVDWTDFPAMNQQGAHPGSVALDSKMRQHFEGAHTIHIPHSNVGVPSPFNPNYKDLARLPHDADSQQKQQQQQLYQQYVRRHMQQQQQFSGQQSQIHQQGPPSYQQLSYQHQQACGQQQWVDLDKLSSVSSQPMSVNQGSYLNAESGDTLSRHPSAAQLHIHAYAHKQAHPNAHEMAHQSIQAPIKGSSVAASSLQRWSSQDRAGWFRPPGGSSAHPRDSPSSRGMSSNQVTLDCRPIVHDRFQSSRPQALPIGQLPNESALSLGGPYGLSAPSGSRGGFPVGSDSEFAVQTMPSSYDSLSVTGGAAAFPHSSMPEADQLPRGQMHLDRSDPPGGANIGVPGTSYSRHAPLFGGPPEGGSATYAATSQHAAGGALTTSRHLSLQPDISRTSITSGASRAGELSVPPGWQQHGRFGQPLGEQELCVETFWQGGGFVRPADGQGMTRRSTPEGSFACRTPTDVGKGAPDAGNVSHVIAAGIRQRPPHAGPSDPSAHSAARIEPPSQLGAPHRFQQR